MPTPNLIAAAYPIFSSCSGGSAGLATDMKASGGGFVGFTYFSTICWSDDVLSFEKFFSIRAFAFIQLHMKVANETFIGSPYIKKQQTQELIVRLQGWV